MSEMDKVLAAVFKDVKVVNINQIKAVADVLDKLCVFTDRGEP